MCIFGSSEKTLFASAERKNQQEVMAQNVLLEKQVNHCPIVNMIPEMLCILNSERQFVYANKSVAEYFKKNKSELLGLRLGEVLNCAYAYNESGGCGTSEHCSVCPGLKTILSVQEHRCNSQFDCEILTVDNDAYNFRIWSYPLNFDGVDYTLLVMRDIASEIYWRKLECVFFHDLTNISSGLLGLLNITENNPELYKRYSQTLINLSQEMIDEIEGQRDLFQYKKNIGIDWQYISNITMMTNVSNLLRNHRVAAEKEIIIDYNSLDISFCTDPRLLKRIIINMTKNALEATRSDGIVTLKSRKENDRVIFEVHNQGFILPDIQLNIFKRSFSTKGSSRGFGTYSIKLLTENYLNGKAYFQSTPEEGTSFFIELPISP